MRSGNLEIAGSRHPRAKFRIDAITNIGGRIRFADQALDLVASADRPVDLVTITVKPV